ncbi:MAG: serine acetyltransferase [Ilumatobacter sp.]|nr:serine acetyltransferase [Ilumatobacter sp.]
MRLLVRHPSFRAVVWFRVAALANRCRMRSIPGLIQRRLLVKYGLEIPPGMDAGGGLYIAHPVGCVLVAEHVGENVTVIAGVTFGTRNDARWPTVGDGVFVGAGARVLGGITIGDGASIGANAVVVHDVEPGATVVGIPARPVVRGS